MKTFVQQWGNSLALRIPKAFASQANVGKGTSVNIKVDKGCLVIEPVKRPKYSHKELVLGITPANRHGETDWGPPQGRETW